MATSKEAVATMPEKIEKRPLTEREEHAAANLRRIWNYKKANGRKLVQKEAAAQFGVQQAMISHYLNGITPLGTVAIMKFSAFLRVPPTEIDPEFEFTSLVPGDVPAEAIEVAVSWMSLPPPIKMSVKALILSAGSDEDI